MNAAAEYFMHAERDGRVVPARPKRETPSPEPEDRGLQTFWQWFAIAVLAFCWIAEASMCAARGF